MLIGIIFVVIFLSILILVHELGHFLIAKKFGLLVEEFGFGLPPRIFRRKIGETIYSLNALPFGGFVKIFGENNLEKWESRERSFIGLKIWQRAAILFAGVFFNFLLGWVAVSIVFSIGVPSAVVITEVVKNSPAAEIGLMAGDKLEGENLTTKSVIDFINEHRGQKIDLKIERSGKIIDFVATPRLNPPEGEGALGIGLVDTGLPRKSILASFWEGLKTSLEMIKIIALAIMNLIGKAFLGKASLEQVTGPIGIVKITAQAGSLGLVYLLHLLALISLNLAVINILPFPALDGGRLFFLMIEKIKGSPINPKIEKVANAFGFALLIFLMVIITIKDIIRL